MMRIVADAHVPYIKEYFGSYGELILKPGRLIHPHDVKQADMLIVRSVTHVDKALLSGSQVKFVGSVTAGADHLDTKWLNEAGIKWQTAAGFNAPPVADYVVSVIAALQKKQYLSSKPLKAAVIGVGNVGKLVFERLQFLGFDVIACDPIRSENEKNFVTVPFQELENLDFISIHVPLTKTGLHPTYHFINKEFLTRQKPGCILLNASRGSVIHSQDLIEYGSHLQWCMDVWEHEPNINKIILQNAVIATPHIAGYSIQSKIRGVDMIYKLACASNIIQEHSIQPITMPHQELAFAGQQHSWQEIVLGVFNPLIVTAMMRTLLLPIDEAGALFDEMRQQFNYRHEFEFTQIVAAQLSLADESLLRQIGLLHR